MALSPGMGCCNAEKMEGGAFHWMPWYEREMRRVGGRGVGMDTRNTSYAQCLSKDY